MEDRTPSGVRGCCDALGAAPSWATSGPQASGQQRITTVTSGAPPQQVSLAPGPSTQADSMLNSPSHGRDHDLLGSGDLVGGTDCLHPNDVGHQKIAEAFAAVLAGADAQAAA
jgi:lysophospholipase L1-like esterase